MARIRTPAKTSTDLSRDGVALPWESVSRLAELLKSDLRLLLWSQTQTPAAVTGQTR